jgi:hypothetical protein
LFQTSPLGHVFRGAIVAADLPCPIHEVNLQYPVLLSASSIRHSHPVVILGVDIKSDLVASDLLMRKNANQMSCNGPAVLPASLRRQFLCELIQLRRGDLRVFLKILLAARKRLLHVTATPVLQRGRLLQPRSAQSRPPTPRTQDRGPERRCHPPQPSNLGDSHHGSQSVAPRPHDAFVPIARDSTHAPGKRVDTLINPVSLALGRFRFCLWIAVLGA